MEKYKKNSCFKPFSATLLIGVILLLVLIPSISAFEFDNVKSYDEVTKTVTIENAFGLGDEIA